MRTWFAFSLLIACVSATQQPCFLGCRFHVCSGVNDLLISKAGQQAGTTSSICSKSDSLRIGNVVSSGHAFVAPKSGDPIPFSSYSPNGMRQRLSGSFLKALTSPNESAVSVIQHETPQQNQRDFLNGICVILPITGVQEVNSERNVINNLQLTFPFTDCVALTLRTSNSAQTPKTTAAVMKPSISSTPKSLPVTTTPEPSSDVMTNSNSITPTSLPVYAPITDEPTPDPLDITTSFPVSSTSNLTSPDTIVSTPTVTLDSPTPGTFNTRSVLTFSASGATFDLDLGGVSLIVNNVSVPNSNITISSTRLIAEANLQAGGNNVSLAISADRKKTSLSLSTSVWIGANLLTVNLVGSGGNKYIKNTTVTAVLSDDLSIRSQSVTTNGSVIFENLPDRTIIIEAKSVDNDIGTTGVIGTAGVVTVNMVSFGNVSSVKNNNFSLGLEGWEIKNPVSVSLVDHVENVGPKKNSSVPVSIRQTLKNTDLRLTTSGEGPQTVKRVFESSFGTTGIRLRYRFVTSEVPNGYFGSKYNDYFSISIRSKEASGSISESATMNGLGLAAFNQATGSTAWRETILRLDSEFDMVEAVVTVANVNDGAFDSVVEIDFIEEVNCDLGEKVKAVLAVGPLDAFAAKAAADDAIAIAKKSKFEGRHNGPFDAFRHCLWNCLMAQRIGVKQAEEVGNIHEECWKNKEAEHEMDLRNNAVGRGYGKNNANCTKLCEQGIDNGDLQTSPRK